MNWQIDTRLSALYGLSETKRQVALIRDRIILGNQQRTQNLLDARRSLDAQTRQATATERRLLILKTAPAPVTMEQASSFAYELRSLIEQRAALSAERDALNALFWIQDESCWPRPSKEGLDALHSVDRAFDRESAERLKNTLTATSQKP
jgi:hypothetical protein